MCFCISDKGPFQEESQVLIHLSNYLIDLHFFQTTDYVIRVKFFFVMQLRVKNQMILYWPRYRADVGCFWPRSCVLAVRGQRQNTNTADRGPVTRSMQNHLTYGILIINYS